MRLVSTLENDQSASTGDAVAAACLFAIVGGLLFGVVVAPAISAVLTGAILGGIVGIIVAYQ